MGQILSWIRGPRDTPALRDVAVEDQSQPSQATPKPAGQVSTVKPAQFEQKASSGSTMATKPGVASTATGGGAGGGVAAGGSASVGTAGKVAPKAKTESASVSQAKATASVPSPVTGAAGAAAAAVTKPKESPKDTAKSATAITTVKADLPKVDPAKTSKPAAAAATATAGNVSVQGKKEEAKPTQTKVQVEVPSAAAKGAKQAPTVDPFDALASILPSADPVRQEPVHTGPEVKEHDVISEKGQKCGEREDTLPPGYRLEDMGPVPADYKPPDVPKPLSTDEALDSLSAGFMSSPVPPASMKQEKKDHVDTISASSAGPASFAPPPVKKSQPPAAVPPADKKAKMEKVSDDFSLEAGLSSAPSKTAGVPHVAVCPPADKKAKMEKGDSMSMDALSALGDLLPENKTKPELPEVRPEDIVTEDKHKREKGVFVGEREDTLPPDYRFDEKELKKLPPRKPEPTLGTGEALDILSTDFMTSSAAPAVHAPVVKSLAPPAQSKVEDLSALDVLHADFVAPTKASGVQEPVPSSAKKTPEKVLCHQEQQAKPSTDKGDSFSLDALSALSDTLPKETPKPELSKLRPEDIVTEDKHKKEKGVFVGEREDTLPPDYRFDEKELKKLPAPKPEPTLGTGEALDILSGSFVTSSAAAAVHDSVVKSSAPPAKSSADFALDALAGDFVSSTAAPAVKSGFVPTETAPQLETGADSALDALSDTLMDINPAPQPDPVPLKDIVKEKKLVEEKLIKMGERDDTLPPEYRPTEEDLKKAAEAKAKAAAAPKKTMDDKTALDLLSSEFSTVPDPTALAASSAGATKLEPPVLDSDPLKPMAGPVLDSLAGTLVPDTQEFKSKTDKPKGKSKSKSRSKKHHAEEPSPTDQLSAQLSSDVVPTSTKKGGKS